MKLRKSCFGMDYEMETIIQALVIQINMVWNQFHEIIHELIRYAHALGGERRMGGWVLKFAKNELESAPKTLKIQFLQRGLLF